MDSGQHAQKRPSNALRIFFSFVTAVVIILCLSYMLRSFVVQPYLIPSGSMENTIMPGDMVFSEKITYLSNQVSAGDIVTFVSPLDEDGNMDSAGEHNILIKRVIAVGGQTVDMVNGVVHVDGVALDESYANGASYPFPAHAPGVSVTFPYTVPEGYIWVMGDNRTLSKDSRFFGAVPASSVTGRAFLVYWPLNRIGLLSH